MATKGFLPLLIGGLLLFALSGRKKAVEDSALQLKVVRVFQDVLGLMRPGWSRWPLSMGQALVLEEGAGYQVQATVTNGSTRAGTPMAASFVVKLEAGFPGVVRFLSQEIRQDLLPSETKTFTSANFTIPKLASRVQGSIIGTLSTLNGIKITDASIPVNLELAATTITGTISVGPTPTATPSPITPFLVSPAPNSILGNSVTFTWDRGNITLYRLDFYIIDSLANVKFALTSTLVSSANVDLSVISAGKQFRASLWWKATSGDVWSQKDYTYTKG